MRIFNWSLVRPDRNKASSKSATERFAPDTIVAVPTQAVTTPPATDAVEVLSSQFDSAPDAVPAVVPLTVVPVPAAAATAAAPVAGAVAAASEAPAMTRRELRERAAATPAPRAKLFGQPAATSRSAKRASAARPEVAVSARRAAAAQATAKKTAPRSAPQAKKVGVKRRVLSNLATVGAMAGVGLILISTTVPANAFMRPETSAVASATSTGDTRTQELTVATAEAPAVTRDGYSVVSMVRKTQAISGNRSFNFTNNPTSAVQWPFPGGSPITSGFGPRQVAGCGFCSTYHQGLDFTPGSGVPIQSIAAGVVSQVKVSSGGLGNHVYVDHVVNGQRVTSVYAHMQYGSIAVATGQTIGVGDLIGLVGSTGASTGAHLHMEVHLDGTPIDPFAWLQANAG